MIDPQVAFDKLTQFQTAKEIADYLRNEGITGHRYRTMACPIAQYMKRHTQRFVYVCPNSTSVLDTDWGVDNTPSITNFIIQFDCGGFPDLEESIDD